MKYYPNVIVTCSKCDASYDIQLMDNNIPTIDTIECEFCGVVPATCRKPRNEVVEKCHTIIKKMLKRLKK